MVLHGHVLICGDHTGGLRSWDLSTLPTRNRQLEGHTAGIRAIDVDPVTNVIFTAADDRCVKMWGEAAVQTD